MLHGAPDRGPNPALADAARELERDGARVTFRYPEVEVVRVDALRVDADVYVVKPAAPTALALAGALHHRGARLLNRWVPTLQARDKVLAAAVLERAGVATPRSLAADRPEVLAPLVTTRPLILKPHTGAYGRGVLVAERPADLPAAGREHGLTFAQEYLRQARLDLKVFAIGRELFGVRKAFGPESYRRAGRQVQLSDEVRALVQRVGVAFGLELYGVDVAETADGPCVIDVNPLPGFRGVPDAGKRLADYIRHAAWG